MTIGISFFSQLFLLFLPEKVAPKVQGKPDGSARFALPTHSNPHSGVYLSLSFVDHLNLNYRYDVLKEFDLFAC